MVDDRSYLPSGTLTIDKIELKKDLIEKNNKIENKLFIKQEKLWDISDEV